MDTDFSSLAARIAADMQDLRGCIIVSRDGLVLGSHPADAESILRPAWLRFASLGDVEKGFIQFASELWVYVRRGPYASFAVSNSVTRPGLLLDELEQVLLGAEEARALQGGGLPAGGEAPRSKPRTPLHPEVKPPAPAPSMADLAASDTSFAELSAAAQKPPEAEAAPPIVIETPSEQPAAGGGSWDLYPEFAAGQPAPASQPSGPQTEPPAAPQPAAPQPAAPQPPRDPAESGEVDRVALAQEFAQLLGDTGYDDEDQQA